MAADPFAPVVEVADLLATFNRPWFIAGGWAIDLFAERKTRDHEDVDVAILRADQAALRAHLRQWSFEKVVRMKREIWREGEWLGPPVHEIRATREGGRPPLLELLLNEADAGLWRFRRNPAVTRPLERIGMRTRNGIPFLAPEIILLYKAREPKGKDDEDFGEAEPRLKEEARGWLLRALEACHPGHAWAKRL